MEKKTEVFTAVAFFEPQKKKNTPEKESTAT